VEVERPSSVAATARPSSAAAQTYAVAEQPFAAAAVPERSGLPVAAA